MWIRWYIFYSTCRQTLVSFPLLSLQSIWGYCSRNPYDVLTCLFCAGLFFWKENKYVCKAYSQSDIFVTERKGNVHCFGYYLIPMQLQCVVDAAQSSTQTSLSSVNSISISHCLGKAAKNTQERINKPIIPSAPFSRRVENTKAWKHIRPDSTTT